MYFDKISDYYFKIFYINQSFLFLLLYILVFYLSIFLTQPLFYRLLVFSSAKIIDKGMRGESTVNNIVYDMSTFLYLHKNKLTGQKREFVYLYGHLVFYIVIRYFLCTHYPVLISYIVLLKNMKILLNRDNVIQ